MKTYYFEATQASTAFNWGKFAILIWDEGDWALPTVMDQERPLRGLLAACGWGKDHFWVLDCQTGEGGCFRHGGMAGADLQKHKIWVCPMYEPFLEWVYRQDLATIGTWPQKVDLDTDVFEFSGYRRPGPPAAEEAAS